MPFKRRIFFLYSLRFALLFIFNVSAIEIDSISLQTNGKLIEPFGYQPNDTSCFNIVKNYLDSSLLNTIRENAMMFLKTNLGDKNSNLLKLMRVDYVKIKNKDNCYNEQISSKDSAFIIWLRYADDLAFNSSYVTNVIIGKNGEVLTKLRFPKLSNCAAQKNYLHNIKDVVDVTTQNEKKVLKKRYIF
jgi:hypothetical protein